METTYLINKKEYKFKSNALIPVLFFNEFKMDIFVEINKISEYLNIQQKINENLKKEEEKGKEVEYVSEDLKPEQKIVLLKLAYLLNKNAENFEKDFNKWLEELNIIDFNTMQDIATKIWMDDITTTVELKKKDEI